MGDVLTYIRNQTTYLSTNTVDDFFGSTWEVQDLVLADLDGDDIIDVLVTEAYSQRIYPGVVNDNIWDAEEPVFFPSPGEGAAGIAAGAFSFDGDDDIDVAAFNQYYTNASIMTNDGSGTLTEFATPQLCAGDIDGIRFGEAADLDGDGNTDFVVTCMAGGVSVALGDDGGAFGELQTLPLAGSFRVYPADLDDDGDLDLVVTSRALERALMFINDGAAQFELSDVQFQAPGPVFGAAVADLDDDGVVDVALSSDAGKQGRVDIYFAEP